MTNTPPPNNNGGKYFGWLTAVRGLTITNALVIVLLVVALAPAYTLYRILNDTGLLDRFMSNFREISGQQSGCTLRAAKQRGGPEIWGISTGFAYSGSDRYAVTVLLDHEPTAEEIYSYCTTLNLIVDFMRDPSADSPELPGTNEPVIRKYNRETSREP